MHEKSDFHAATLGIIDLLDLPPRKPDPDPAGELARALHVLDDRWQQDPDGARRSQAFVDVSLKLRGRSRTAYGALTYSFHCLSGQYGLGHRRFMDLLSATARLEVTLRTIRQQAQDEWHSSRSESRGDWVFDVTQEM